jgi:hypothetical protein
MLSFHTFGESVCLVVELILVALELESPNGVGGVELPLVVVVLLSPRGVGDLELLLVAVELLSPKGVGEVELPLVAVVLLSPKGVGDVELPLVAAVVEADEAAPHCGISVEMPFTTAVALSMMLTCCASPALRSS